MPQVDAHGYDEYDDDMQDSDKFIPPPKLTSAPASIVPFAQAPSSMGAALGAHSAHSTPTRGSDLRRLSSKDTSFRSKDASFRSQGSGYSSEPAREGDAHPETLPHMFNKDWELNLDALEVSTLLSPLTTCTAPSIVPTTACKFDHQVTGVAVHCVL